jgi:hypothetical protein
MTTLSLTSASTVSVSSVSSSVFGRAAAAVSTLARQLWKELNGEMTPVSYEPRNAEEMLEWAYAHERTQPSLAADLRAAALRHMAQEEARAAR